MHLKRVLMFLGFPLVLCFRFFMSLRRCYFRWEITQGIKRLKEDVDWMTNQGVTADRLETVSYELRKAQESLDAGSVGDADRHVLNGEQQARSVWAIVRWERIRKQLDDSIAAGRIRVIHDYDVGTPQP